MNNIKSPSTVNVVGDTCMNMTNARIHQHIIERTDSITLLHTIVS